MKELLIRALSGALYVALLLLALYSENALIALFFVFGVISLMEFNKLIGLKSFIPFIIFTLLFGVFGFWQNMMNTDKGFDEATQILHVITVFVQLFLIKDLFSGKSIPLFQSKRFIITTFYLSSGFIFL